MVSQQIYPSPREALSFYLREVFVGRYKAAPVPWRVKRCPLMSAKSRFVARCIWARTGTWLPPREK